MAMESLRNGRPSGPLQPSKFPAIPSATPPPGKDWLVPVSRGEREDQRAAFSLSADMLAGEDRVHVLETRLGVTEKSNRVLLEEVIRLQGELRLSVRRNEESIKEEKVSRNQIESSLHIVNDLINKLSGRIKSAEERITEEKSALSSLVSHTKGVEQAVVASQNNMVARKDSQTTRIQELTLQLHEMQRSRDQMEKQAFSLAEEVRTVRTKVESQAMELNTTVNDLRLRSRRLEEENKIQLDALRKQGDLFSSTETNTTHLRGQVETRLAELRDVVLELRNRQDQEATERRTLEQHLQEKVNTLQQNLSDQNRKREEAMHALDMIHREKEHSAENEKLRLQGRMTETVEDMNKRMLTKEIKLREELQEKFNTLEKQLQQEQQVRHKHESHLKEENEKLFQGLKKVSNDDLLTFRDTLQSERQKNKEGIQKLDESISLLEKQLSENRRQSDKVVAAEIKSRKQHEKSTNEKLEHLNEKLSLATATLQTAMGGVSGNLANHTDKVRAEMKTMITTSEQASTRAMTDMDARLQSLKQKVNNLEQQLDGRISEATAILAQNLREKVESISLWQDVTSQTIRELNHAIQGLPNDIYAIEEKQKLMKTDMDSRMTTETDSRVRDIETLRHDLAMMKNQRQPQYASIEEMQEIQTSIRKLAESVQTVKTVIGMKIQSEQKLRLTGIEDLQIQINRLKSQSGMISGMHSTMPLYMRPETQAGYMEDFMAHDITQDIPYGRSSLNQPNTRAGMDSAEPLKDGYAAKYSRAKASGMESEPPHTGRQPLDTVSEGSGSGGGQADWNLLSSVAYGQYDGKDDAGQDREPRALSRITDNETEKASRESKRVSPRDKRQQLSPDGGWAQSPVNRQPAMASPRDIEVARQTPQTEARTPTEKIATPVDRATEASEKGGGHHDEVDANSSQELNSLTSNRKQTPQDSRGDASPARNTQDWEPASPRDKNPTSANTEKQDDQQADPNENQPITNRLDWKPVTPGQGDDEAGKGAADQGGQGKDDQEADQNKNQPMTNRLDWKPATPVQGDDNDDDDGDDVDGTGKTVEKGHWGQDDDGQEDQEKPRSAQDENQRQSARQMLAAV